MPTGSNLMACNAVRIDMNDGSVVGIGNAAAVADVSDVKKTLKKKQRMRQRAGCADSECALEKVAPVHVLEAMMAEEGAAMSTKQVQAFLHEKGYCVQYSHVETACRRWRRHEKARVKRQAAATHVVEPGTPDNGARVSLEALLAATAAAVSS